jgi:hypothetical protein
MAGDLRIELAGKIQPQTQQIGIFAVILIKAVQAGLLTEGAELRIRSRISISDCVSGSRLASQTDLLITVCLRHMQPDMQRRKSSCSSRRDTQALAYQRNQAIFTQELADARRGHQRAA